MESSTILTADVLDIIFEGRNKEYGAYELRRTYRKRLTLSLTVMLALCLLFIGFAFAGRNAAVKPDLIFSDSVTLTRIDEPPPPVETPPPPPPKQPEPPKVEMAKFTPPKIVRDEEVKEDEKPPEMAKLEETKIGLTNQDGLKDDGLVAPPVDDGNRGVVEAPKKEEEDWGKTFTKVEIESEYPGGPPAWQRYLKRNLNFPQEAVDNEIQGAVVVSFIVDTEGIVSNVAAISGPEELRAEAVRVIKKSGKWTPAIQNGHQVKSYKTQSILFRLNTE